MKTRGDRKKEGGRDGERNAEVHKGRIREGEGNMGRNADSRRGKDKSV